MSSEAEIDLMSCVTQMQDHYFAAVQKQKSLQEEIDKVESDTYFEVENFVRVQNFISNDNEIMKNEMTYIFQQISCFEKVLSERLDHHLLLEIEDKQVERQRRNELVIRSKTFAALTPKQRKNMRYMENKLWKSLGCCEHTTCPNYSSFLNLDSHCGLYIHEGNDLNECGSSSTSPADKMSSPDAHGTSSFPNLIPQNVQQLTAQGSFIKDFEAPFNEINKGQCDMTPNRNVPSCKADYKKLMTPSGFHTSFVDRFVNDSELFGSNTPLPKKGRNNIPPGQAVVQYTSSDQNSIASNIPSSYEPNISQASKKPSPKGVPGKRKQIEKSNSPNNKKIRRVSASIGDYRAKMKIQAELCKEEIKKFEKDNPTLKGLELKKSLKMLRKASQTFKELYQLELALHTLRTSGIVDLNSNTNVSKTQKSSLFSKRNGPVKTDLNRLVNPSGFDTSFVQKFVNKSELFSSMVTPLPNKLKKVAKKQMSKPFDTSFVHKYVNKSELFSSMVTPLPNKLKNVAKKRIFKPSESTNECSERSSDTLQDSETSVPTKRKRKEMEADDPAMLAVKAKLKTQIGLYDEERMKVTKANASCEGTELKAILKKSRESSQVHAELNRLQKEMHVLRTNGCSERSPDTLQNVENLALTKLKPLEMGSDDSAMLAVKTKLRIQIGLYDEERMKIVKANASCEGAELKAALKKARESSQVCAELNRLQKEMHALRTKRCLERSRDILQNLETSGSTKRKRIEVEAADSAMSVVKAKLKIQTKLYEEERVKVAKANASCEGEELKAVFKKARESSQVCAELVRLQKEIHTLRTFKDVESSVV